MEINLEQYLTDLEYLINIDSGTENVEGNWRVARFFTAAFEEAGYDVQAEDVGEKQRPIVIATTPGFDRYKFYLGGHIDTVFPDGTTAERPFRIQDGIAYGPGTVDMKAGALLILYIARELIAANPEIPLCIVLNSDEEIGSQDSVEVLRTWGAKCETVFIFEGGRKKGQLVNERKGIAKYRIDVEGIASHSGTAPHLGASAIVELSNAIIKLHKLNNFDKGTTINVGLMEGGTALNMVAPSATATMEVRYREEKEFRRIERALQGMESKAFVEGTKTTITRLSHYLPLVLTEKTRDLMEKLEPFQLEYVRAGGISDANRLASLDIPILDGCGPSGGFPHSEKEFLNIETVEKRYELFCKIMKKQAHSRK